jgi:dihydrofolate reductase
MRISLIAAVAKNGVIGKDGALPWRLPDDMRQFKKHTLGKPVIMGRKTWESLRGKALVDRLNIVVTRQKNYRAEGAVVVDGLDAALARADSEEAFVIGGSELYAAALAHADRLVITHVDAELEGDAYFPAVDWSAWRPIEEQAHAADERHAHPFRIVVYERR